MNHLSDHLFQINLTRHNDFTQRFKDLAECLTYNRFKKLVFGRKIVIDHGLVDFGLVSYPLHSRAFIAILAELLNRLSDDLLS